MVPRDLVAIDQRITERFSPDTPLCTGGTSFQTACPECSRPYTLRGLVKVKAQKFVERKEKFTLFSDHNGSLLRRQPGATKFCISLSFAH